jgi:CHASE2 domain-containing sensor protein
VDIDDESVGASWEHEGRVSRGKLRDAITKILEVSPALLIVDVDLSYPRLGDPGNADVFQAICSNLASPMVLVWMTDDPMRLRGGHPDALSKPHQAAEQDNALLSRAPCILEPAKETRDQAEARVYWVKPSVKVDPDLVVRRWPRCASLSDECESKEGLSIAGLAAVISAEPKQRQIELEANLSSQSASEFRIVYTLPWEDGQAPPILGGDVPLVTRVSAQVVTNAESLPQEWKNRILIVGGSYGAAEDVHQTPIGPMPGAMIIANAIHSLHQFDFVKDPSPLGKFFAASIAIVSVAVILHALDRLRVVPRFMSLFIAFGFTLVIMIAESYVVLVLRWLPEGIWLDATLPCIGVILHHWFEAGHSGHEHELKTERSSERPQENRVS